MDISWFFCDPYCSSQRGQNERFNRDIRRFVWKGSDMKNLTPSMLKNYTNLINMWHHPSYNHLSAKIMEESKKGYLLK
jgi:IS30 family transposase